MICVLCVLSVTSVFKQPIKQRTVQSSTKPMALKYEGLIPESVNSVILPPQCLLCVNKDVSNATVDGQDVSSVPSMAISVKGSP